MAYVWFGCFVVAAGCVLLMARRYKDWADVNEDRLRSTLKAHDAAKFQAKQSSEYLDQLQAKFQAANEEIGILKLELAAERKAKTLLEKDVDALRINNQRWRSWAQVYRGRLTSARHDQIAADSEIQELLNARKEHKPCEDSRERL